MKAVTTEEEEEEEQEKRRSTIQEEPGVGGNQVLKKAGDMCVNTVVCARVCLCVCESVCSSLNVSYQVHDNMTHSSIHVCFWACVCVCVSEWETDALVWVTRLPYLSESDVCFIVYLLVGDGWVRSHESASVWKIHISG